MSLLARLRAMSLEVTVFLAGALLMTYEIIGSRVLAPYIGTSTYVWTSLIGVILASLSTGYWLGGVIADRRPKISVLAGALLIAGSSVAATLIIKDLVLTAIASLDVGLELRSLLAALILFAPASICLGFVTPFAAKLRLASLDTAGRTVGRLYALSTIGSILGTFAAGFFLVPFVGSTRTLYVIMFGLLGLSFLLAPFSISRINVSAVVLMIAAVGVSEASAYFLWTTHELVDIDSEYNRVQVFRAKDPDTGRDIRAMQIDPTATQSAMFLDSDELVFAYSRYYHLARLYAPNFRRVLVIGGAGYSIPKEILRRYPQATVDVVEIDPLMTEMARRYFGLHDDPRLRIAHQDGRIFLNHAPTAGYDVIMIDAFSSLLSVPDQLTTIEAVREINRILRPEGVVIFNVGSAVSGRASGFLQAEINTYRSVFDQVDLFKVRPDRPNDELQNLIIVASPSAKAMPSTDDNELKPLLANRYPFEPDARSPVLTDDLAPVQYYASIALNSRKNN